MQVQRAAGATERIVATVRLLHKRGFCLPAVRVALLCVGGPVPVAWVEAAAARDARLACTGDLVHLAGDDASPSVQRQRRHTHDSGAYWDHAEAFTRLLARHCPWLEVAWVGGSMASGGFEEGDDIDFNLLVQDDTKYLSYLLALALSVPVSWRLRRQVPGRTTPLMPKVICINVVWEARQARPFVRSDDAMGMELLLAQPVHGEARLQAVYAANPLLTGRFPQLAEIPPGSAAPPPSPLSHVLRWVTALRLLRRGLNGTAFALVWLLHAYLRVHRRRMPDVRRHVAEMEEHKRPYGILERPRKVGQDGLD